MKRHARKHATDKAYLFGNMASFTVLFCLVSASIILFLHIDYVAKIWMILLSAVVLSHMQHRYLVRIVNPFVERFFPDEERNEANRKASEKASEAADIASRRVARKAREAADRASRRAAREAREAADKDSRKGRWGE
jgi:hypothetical protein